MRPQATFAEAMAFEANLREFANRVGIICALEAGHKLPPDEAFCRIEKLWKALKRSKRNLNIRAAVFSVLAGFAALSLPA
jgi:hypothetical protein